MSILILLLALVTLVGVGFLISAICDYARKPEPAPPVIMTKYGAVTEQWRKQAALNMLAEPDLRAKVYQVVLAECGGDDLRAEAEMHRRYPELYESCE